MMYRRIEVDNFADIMEIKLNKNDHKTGWKSCSNTYLLTRLKNEVTELENALINGKGVTIVKEAADVANFAMMIADNNTTRGECDN